MSTYVRSVSRHEDVLTCNIRQRGVSQASSTHGSYIPKVTQLRRITRMEIRSNHVLWPIYDELIKENRLDFVNKSHAPSRPLVYIYVRPHTIIISSSSCARGHPHNHLLRQQSYRPPTVTDVLHYRYMVYIVTQRVSHSAPQTLVIVIIVGGC